MNINVTSRNKYHSSHQSRKNRFALSLASVCLQRETTIRILNLQKKTHGNKIPGSYPLQSSVLLIIFSRQHVYTITKFCGKICISDSLSDYTEMEHIQRILLWKCIILVEKVIFEFDIFFNNLRGHELILKNFWCVSLVIHFNNFIKLSIYDPPPF